MLSKIFLKKFLKKRQIWVSEIHPFVQMSEHKEPERFFDYLGSIARQELADVGTDWFKGAEAQFEKEPNFTNCSQETMNSLVDIAFAEQKKSIAARLVFPKDTIVLDKFLLAEKEQGRRRFSMAHEASHFILERMHSNTNAARFHTEFDNEQVYTREELAQMFASVEWQADTMGASLLMPRFIVENALAKFTNSQPIKIYGDTTFASRDKVLIRKMANYLGVSYKALVIRLRNLGMLEYKYPVKQGFKWMCKFNYTDPKSGDVKTEYKRGFATKRDAKQYEEDFLENLTKSAEPSDIEYDRTFGDVFQEYLMSHKRADIKESTLETKFNIFNKHIFPTFENVPVKSITDDDIAEWQKKIKRFVLPNGKKLSEAYLRTIQSQFNSIINYANDKGYLKANPL